MQHKEISYILLFMLMLAIGPLQTSDAAPGSISKQQAYQLLKKGTSESVHALPAGDREILLAKLSLDAGKTEEAIQILSRNAVKNSPLAALMRAEAYRRQSVEAAQRAGRYAHAVSGDIGRLQKARLNIGLDQAETRLQAFMTGHAVRDKSAGASPVRVATTTRSHLPDAVRQTINMWVKDWESRNAEAYLGHYHPGFRTKKHDFTSWSAYKRRVNKRKKYIKVKVSRLTVLRGPEKISEGEAILVAFHQQYQSSNYKANSRKQLYLVRQHVGGKWLILYEGEASRPYHRSKIQAASQVSLNSKNLLKTSAPGKWTINLGSFDSLTNAEQMASGIQLSGPQQPFVSSATVGDKAVHRVGIGFYASRGKAVEAMLRICPRLGLSGCWLENTK